MKKTEFQKKAVSVLASLLLAGGLTVLLDVISVWFERALSVPKFALLYAAVFAVIHFVPLFRGKLRTILSAVLTSAAALLAVAVLCWYCVSRDVTYTPVDNGKAQLYGQQRVMLLVPHQDDDINVLGGVIEEYVKYGSEVYVVFSTNGDYYGLAETRYHEAMDALEFMGVPEDYVIFLGYGDQWQADGPHIYNAARGEVVTSVFGRTETYGMDFHPAWREGTAYTMENFLGDIETVILEYRPDVLYCVDYDYNIDHRALSMSFEKVMGKILAEREDYRPLVYKGFAYSTAWEAERDFYRENLLSAQDVFDGPYQQEPEIYKWNRRVRLPVNAESLSRSLFTARANKALSMYASQGANMYGIKIFNSDKVFWRRDTSSLCYQAQVETSSGSAELLTDFMLLETRNLRHDGDAPYDGVWVPEESDSGKTASVTFPQPRDLTAIVLYDNPDGAGNVENARITFADGTSLETGPLDPGGAAAVFPVEKSDVTSFTVSILEGTGRAGLTEIEAYEQVQQELPFVKIMDAEGNFVYDYWIAPEGTQSFFLYSTAGESNFNLTCSGDACGARWQGEAIVVECPVGESCIVTVTSQDGAVSDSVYIHNPGSAERAWKMFWLRAEETVMNLCDAKRLHERIFVCRLVTKLSALAD